MTERTRAGRNATPDNELDLHRLHCRYAIRWGSNMKVANELWTEMKGRYPNREAHISALSDRLRSSAVRPDRQDAESPSTLPPVAADDELSSIEGDPRLLFHVRRERDPALVEAKREAVRAATGCLQCETCGFTTQAAYPRLDGEVCEIHHRLPLAEAAQAVETRLMDLAVLCANCHRAIHRTRPLMSVEEFRSRFCSPNRLAVG